MERMKKYPSEYIEGEVYELVKIAGHEFEIVCGYNTEQDKKVGVVIPIYPDFIKSPKYTEDGYPLVTCLQDACEYYKVIPESDIENSCIDCKYFSTKRQNVIGICKCKARKINFDN